MDKHSNAMEIPSNIHSKLDPAGFVYTNLLILGATNFFFLFIAKAINRWARNSIYVVLLSTMVVEISLSQAGWVHEIQ